VRRTAIHEAAHAVIGRVLGMVCGEATIVPDFDLMQAGYAVAEDPWVIVSAWDERLKFREPVSVMRGRIMTFMAGREAEIVACGPLSAYGDGEDLRQIAMMADYVALPDDQIERLRGWTRVLVRRHLRKIEAVADALIATDKLAATEMDDIVDRMTDQRERDRAARIAIARK
jgi:ATP-dependent Zn protease